MASRGSRVERDLIYDLARQLVGDGVGGEIHREGWDEPEAAHEAGSIASRSVGFQLVDAASGPFASSPRLDRCYRRRVGSASRSFRASCRVGDSDMARVRIRIYLGDGHSVGRGKAQLLEAVGELGSISAAARSMGMAYRHAWELIDDMNQCFRSPVVTAVSGGRAGGGATLTPFGREVVRRYRVMEKAALRAMAKDLEALEREVKEPAASSAVRRP